MPMNPRLLRPIGPRGRYRSLRVGLVAYWPMNESASSGDVTVEDWTGRGNNLTSNNTVPSVAGIQGNGREFTAANSEYLAAAGNNADLRFMDGRSWTLAGWMWQSTWGSSQIWCGRDNVGNREIVFDTRAAGNNRIVCQISPGGATSTLAQLSLDGVTGFTTNTWHFWAFSFNAATRTLSGWGNSGVGGVLNISAVAPAGTFPTSVNPFRLGGRPWPGNELFYTGRLDEVAKWDRVLSSSELLTLWNSGAGIDLRQ
jgi:hypothetical protein